MQGYQRVNISDNENYPKILSTIDNTKKLYIILIIIPIIILTFYIIFSRSYSIEPKIQEYQKKLRVVTKDEIIEFHRVNNLGILLDTKKYPLANKPDISIITTLHNQAHCIHKAVRSVQNQSFKNLEMIIIDDCSMDNSTATVENLMKEDERIILLKNELNEGVMIARNKGIRQARGKYICVLDADDTLANKDILKYSFELAELGQLDVVEFYSVYYNKGVFKSIIHNHGKNLGIIYQPELKTKFYSLKESGYNRAMYCRTIWGKIIKNEVFQRALDFIPEKYANDFILGFEDTMITISLYHVAESYYNLNIYGYYYSFDERKGRFPLLKDKKCKRKEGIITRLDHLKYLQFLIDIYEDNKFYKQVIYNELKAINNYSFSNFKKSIKSHFNWAYNILDVLLNSTYLTKNQKEKVQQIKDDVKENEKNSKKT